MKKISSLSDVELGRPANIFFSELFDEIYLVGGAIRDELLSLPSTDLDYCTPLSTEEIKHKLKSVGLSFRDDAEKFGTIATRLGLFDIQITTYRSDDYSSGNRKPLVTYSKDIISDLERRDFTINSIAVSKKGIEDPFAGLSDLENKIIRAVGDAELRFEEDPLRILRAYRFVSQLGFEMSDSTLSAASSRAHLIPSLSSARIGSELNKIVKGKYWSDSLLEMADTGVLGGAFEPFEFSGTINTIFLQEKLEAYSLAELDLLSTADRWGVIFAIVYESRLGKAAVSKPTQKFVKSLGDWLELGKVLIDEIDSSLDANYARSKGSNRLTERIDDLRQSLVEYSRDGDDFHRNYIESTLEFELSRLDFRKSDYDVCQRRLYRSIELLDFNFKFMIETTDSGLRASKATRYKMLYFDRVKYLFACVLINESILDKDGSVVKIIEQVIRLANIKSKFKFNQDDQRRLLEEAIILVFKRKNRRFLIGDFEEFITKHSKFITDERKFHLRKNNLFDIAHSHHSSALQRRDAYQRILELYSNNGLEKDSEEYIELEMEHTIWACYSTETLEDFWRSYDLLDRAAYKILEQDRYDSVKKSYLASASALAYALTMNANIDEKIAISRMIVTHYLMSGTAAGKRNASRFRIYLDWFKILVAVGKVGDIKADLPPLIHDLRLVKSLGYIDEDEQYFIKELKQLSETRDNISYTIEFLNYIAGNIKNFRVRPGLTLSSISVLLDERLISYDDAFKVFQNWCVIQSNDNLEDITFKSIEQVYSGKEVEEIEKSDNVITIEGGESEVVEFKSSFKYNIDAKMLDKTGDLPYACIKTIASFLNTSGGQLFIGVSDKSEIIGLEETDFKVLKTEDPVAKKIDIIKLQIDEMLDKLIGSGQGVYVSIVWETYLGKTFLVVTVPRSRNAVFCDNRFYVRTSSSCRELHGNDMLQYIDQHFKEDLSQQYAQ